MTVGPTLPHEVTPEDLALGYLWGSRFRNAYDEVAKGGTIYGTPLINKSVEFNGTTDYISYKLNGQFSKKDPLGCNIVIEKADFTVPEGVERVIFDSVTTLEYIIRILDSNVFQLRLGNTTIVNLVESAWTPYWNSNGRNVITFSGTSGSVDIYMNLQQIAFSTAVAWTPVDISNLIIGSRAGTAGYFKGKISYIKFYNRLIMKKEHENIFLAIPQVYQ